MTPREYHAQREAERWQQRETLRLEMLGRVRQAIGQLAPGFPTIQAVYLFGSLVQPGRFTPGSDIDVAVDSEQAGDWLAAESAFWRQLEETVQWVVDLRPYKPPITHAIADYGECVYARKSDHYGIEKAESCDVYDLVLQEALNDFIGKLFIDWGPGTLAWIQYAERNNKRVTELRKEFQEPAFPGFLNFILPLSKLESMPGSWITALQSSRGIYLLTCPKTKEQYVGSATGESGFWGRWQAYIHTGHGGNLGLKSRDLSDYQVSILEVAGTSATPDDIRMMEGRWQYKLQSQEMGLNRNLARRS